MAIDIETLRTDIQAYLEQSNLAVFRGVLGMQETPSLFWDTEREPDFRKFLAAAEKAGVRMIVFDYDQFTQDEIDDAFESLDDAGFTRDERRGYETRMRELQKYEGFTSRVELMFSLESRIYTYRMQAEWYSEWQDLIGELEFVTDVEEGDGQDPLPGYFSTN
jgi:hypothetical protein